MLSLQVTPADLQLEPGGETTIDMLLKDANGQAVPGAELAVVVVDEAILALSNYQLGDPLSVFYTDRPADLESNYSRTSIVLIDPLAWRKTPATRCCQKRLRCRQRQNQWISQRPCADIQDPFQHEIIYLKDPKGIMPRVDIIIAQYKWELEGLLTSKPDKVIPINVLPKPYLIAMKLKAGGPKDDHDVIELYEILTEEEKSKTL